VHVEVAGRVELAGDVVEDAEDDEDDGVTSFKRKEFRGSCAHAVLTSILSSDRPFSSLSLAEAPDDES
jgi:hypothetical protein